MVVFAFVKHNGLCGRVTDSNYFYTEESIMCTNFQVRVTVCSHVTRMVVTVHVIYEGLIGISESWLKFNKTKYN